MKNRLLDFSGESLCPQEYLCGISRTSGGLCIGLPAESTDGERRFPLTPEVVDILVSRGNRIIVESNAALPINYSDLHYAEAGAEIVNKKAEVFMADIILKVSTLTDDEAMLIKPGATVISLLQLQYQSLPRLQLLMKKKVTLVAFDQYSDECGSYPFSDAMAEVDGCASVAVATSLLSNVSGGKGMLMGGVSGVPPADVVILGGGLAGCAAARCAIGLGANVKLFDRDISLLRTARLAVSSSLFTSNIHPQVLSNALKSADILIGTSGFEEEKLSEDYVRKMKKGSILIDLCIESGGCIETSRCETSPRDSVYERFGVLHYCMSSIGSKVARTASMALSNQFVRMFIRLETCASIGNMIKVDEGFRKSIYLFNGKIVNGSVGRRFGVASSDIMLFLSLF